MKSKELIPIENYGLEHAIKVQRDAFYKSINQARENFLKLINERRESFLKSINQNYYGYSHGLSAVASKPFLFDLDSLGACTAMSRLADRSDMFRRATAKKFESSVSRINSMDKFRKTSILNPQFGK